MKFTADENRIQELLLQGLSSNEIREKLGLNCTRETLDRYIKSKGLKRKQINIQGIIKDFDDGKFPKDIATLYQINIKQVYGILKRNGRDPAKYQYKSERFSHLFNPLNLPVDEIKERLLKRESVRAIADSIGVKKESLQRFINKNRLRHESYFISDSQVQEIKRGFEEGKKVAEISKSIDLPDYTVSRALRKLGYKPDERRYHRHPGQFVDTRPERAVKFILDILGIEYVHPYYIGKFSVDFFIPKSNLLLDVDGEYWHGRFEENQHAQVEYVREKDLRKTEYILSNSKAEYLRIWELETLSKMSLFNMLKSKLGVGDIKVDYELTDVEVKITDVARARTFVEGLHYSGSIGNYKTIIGAFVQRELIAIMVIGKGVYTQEEHISRFCIDPRFQKPNLASYVISRGLKLLNINRISSFADSTQDHDGSLYKACGFKLIAVTSPSYYYVDAHQNKYHKKTIYNHARRMRIQEANYASRVGLVKVQEDVKYKYFYESTG